MIRLESLTIGDFRGIHNGHIEGLTNVNVLVGRNNSGKTSVLEAISRVRCAAVENTAEHIDKTNEFWRKVRPDSNEMIWYNGAEQAKLVAKLAISSDSFTIENVIKRPEKGDPRPFRYELLDNSRQYHRQADLFLGGMEVVRPSDAFDRGTEQDLWQRLYDDRSDKRLAPALNTIFELNAENFVLAGDQIRVLFERFSLPLDSQGDGTRAAIRVLIVANILKDTLLILEEPENYQHPGSLARLANEVCKITTENRVQLIVSTHSIEAVRAFVEAARTARFDAAVFHLSLVNGRQTTQRLSPEAVETLTDTGVDIRFLDLYA